LIAIKKLVETNPVLWNALFISLQQELLARFGRTMEGTAELENIREDWHLYKTQERLLNEAGFGGISVHDQITLIQWIYQTINDCRSWTFDTLDSDLDRLLLTDGVQNILKTNLYDGVLWFNLEAAERFETLMRLIGYFESVFNPAASASMRVENVMLMQQAADLFHQRMVASDYHFDRLILDPQAQETEDSELAAAPDSDEKASPSE
jgi:hypothetical protein